MKKEHYVYIYLDIRKKGKHIYENLIFDFEPFYVGKGKGLRFKQHLYNIKRDKNFSKRKIVKEIIEETGLNPKIIKIYENLTDEKSCELEIELIEKIGRKDKNKGPLLNRTDGGEGANTSKYRIYRPLTPEIKEKISNNKKNKSWGKHSEESKRKISSSNKGRKFSEEHKDKLKTKRAKRKISKETRNKCSKSSKGKINIKRFSVVDPNGKEFVTKYGLTKFCEENNLSAPNMIKVANGERKHHKGWKVKRI